MQRSELALPRSVRARILAPQGQLQMPFNKGQTLIAFVSIVGIERAEP
jgi:hypothetical protein